MQTVQICFLDNKIWPHTKLYYKYPQMDRIFHTPVFIYFRILCYFEKGRIVCPPPTITRVSPLCLHVHGWLGTRKRVRDALGVSLTTVYTLSTRPLTDSATDPPWQIQRLRPTNGCSFLFVLGLRTRDNDSNEARYTEYIDPSYHRNEGDIVPDS